MGTSSSVIFRVWGTRHYTDLMIELSSTTSVAWRWRDANIYTARSGLGKGLGLEHKLYVGCIDVFLLYSGLRNVT